MAPEVSYINELSSSSSYPIYRTNNAAIATAATKADPENFAAAAVLVLLEDAEVRVAEKVGVVALKVVDGVAVTGVLVATWFPPMFVGGIMVMETPLAEQRDELRSNISGRRIRLVLCASMEVEDISLR